MKTLVARFAHDALTFIASKLVITGCWIGCHRPEAPDELFK
ncbi:cyclic lactone autoinducer peptide [Paenibacillus sp. SYP-B3998]|uniref:Cyclic lactone autoinducer peptide n=1 Tax=Paenibacillus sp. SYP-B3998 TaxID=2678564 RepID=A0A6G3ZV72_9BACL|nr:cyclic lactone autoinducer peptide [Paenibacillus sp. SYP-B3998]